jgi:Ca2+-binding RTX toxin-like protein
LRERRRASCGCPVAPVPIACRPSPPRSARQTNGPDTVYGRGGDDAIFGLGGNDVLVGGAGADYLDGGDGRDTASYRDSKASVYVSLRQHIGGGGDAEGDELFDIENLQGSDYGDLLIGDHHVNKLEGFDGNDYLKGWGGNDYLLGGAGDDIIEGGAGGDAINGDFGIDTASYEGSPEGVIVDLQFSNHGGHAEEDSLLNIENLTGSSHHDFLGGDNGDNVLRGLDGSDSLNGRGGVDILWGGDDGDNLDGGNGPDALFGEAGGDYMIGGHGNDHLYGGADADTFAWYDIVETSTSVLLADAVLDFNAAEGDRIDLEGVDASLVTAGDQAFTFIGTAAFSGAPGEVRYHHSGGNTYIEMQTGTSADPEGVIRLAGIHTPEASWFYL